MPLPGPDCIIPEDVCCTTFYDIAESLLALLLLALSECSQDTPCQPAWTGYVTMGQGDDGITDALSVAIGAVTPAFASQGAGTLKGPTQMVVPYTARILESGWPMVYDGPAGPVFPDPVIQNALARHAYAHGERMYTKMVGLAKSRAMLPNSAGCANVTLGPLTPIPPLGGVVGFHATMTVTLTGW